ncbi:MAG: hypothetical protein ACI8RZ_002312 [Myxococcota bacterium]|jgi:hypothetical protein
MPTVTHRPPEDEPLTTTKSTSDTVTDPLSSVAVLSASGQSELSFDDYFTPRLVEQLKGDRSKSLDDVLDGVSNEVIQREDDYGEPMKGAPSQAPTIARIGKGGKIEESGTKKAVLVGNSDYGLDGKGVAHDLPNAKKDAKKLSGALKSRKFDSDVHANQTADQMRGLYTASVNDSALTEGDSVVLYFAGHGTALGPVGTGGTYDGFHEAADAGNYQAGTLANYPDLKSPDEIKKLGISEEAYAQALNESNIEETSDADILPNSAFSSLIGLATAKGLHLRIIIDACFSGRTTDMVRDEYLSSIAEGSKDNPTITKGVECAMALDGWKETLMAWRRGVTVDGKPDDGSWKSTMQPAIAALMTTFTDLTGVVLTAPPASTDPIKDIAAIQDQIDVALNAMIVKLQAIKDGEDED